jgi:hypothetical protein
MPAPSLLNERLLLQKISPASDLAVDLVEQRAAVDRMGDSHEFPCKSS